VNGLTYVHAVEELHALGLATGRHRRPTRRRCGARPSADARRCTVVDQRRGSARCDLGNQLRMPNVLGLPQQMRFAYWPPGLRVPPWAINYQAATPTYLSGPRSRVLCHFSRPQAGSLVPIGRDLFGSAGQ
jgi:hypothetical protein